MNAIETKEGSYFKTAISVFGLRDTLLYFENVIPMTGTIELGLSLGVERLSNPSKYDQRELIEILSGLLIDVLPERLRNEIFKSKLKDLYQLSTDYLTRQFAEQAAGRPITPMDPNALAPYRSMVDDYGLRYYPLCTAPEFVKYLETETNDLAVTIQYLRLIDPNRATLQQLLEFRKDSEAMLRLRRFRLFTYENYLGKTRDFIEDDIQTRLAAYEDVVRKWGFETKAAAFTALMDSKMVAGGIAGSFLTAFLKEPSLAIVSALLTTGITVGKVAIELGKRHFAFKEMATANPVSYVQYVREKL